MRVADDWPRVARRRRSDYLRQEKDVDERGPFTLVASGNEAELQLLREVRADVLVDAVANERQRWARAIQQCGVDERVFARGAAVVTSRAFSMQEKRLAGSLEAVTADDALVDTLIPLIDMANHRFDAANDYSWAWSVNSIAWFPANLPLRAGDELFDSYGPKARQARPLLRRRRCATLIALRARSSKARNC